MGRKVKGTETCGQTMMDLGTSLMTGLKLTTNSLTRIAERPDNNDMHS